MASTNTAGNRMPAAKLSRISLAVGILLFAASALVIFLYYGKITIFAACGLALGMVGLSLIVYAPKTRNVKIGPVNEKEQGIQNKDDGSFVPSIESDLKIQRRLNLGFNAALGVILALTLWTLFQLNPESPLGMYVSVMALEYFVCVAIIQPRKNFIDLPALALFAGFILVIVFKVLELI